MKLKHRLKNQVSISKNAIIVDDDQPNIVRFTKPLIISSDSVHHSGIRYDIENMDISTWNGKITADHEDRVDRIVGNAINLQKTGNKVTIDGIDFASNRSPYALLTRNLMVDGYVSDVSIETLGKWPNDDGVIEESKVVGLSVVVQGNNPDAHLNQIIKNSIVEAKKLGLKTKEIEETYQVENSLEENIKEDEMKFVTIKNTRDFAIELSYKNAVGEQVTYLLEPGKTVDVSEDQAKALESVIATAVAPKADETAELKEMIEKQAIELESLKKEMVEKSEPEFAKSSATAKTNSVKDMSIKQQNQILIDAACEGASLDLKEKALDINKYRLESLQEAEKIDNTVTIESMGNFVVAPEQYTQIVGYRPRFDSLLSKVNFQETLALEFAWLVRDGDINMQEVEFCDDDENGNLKPITEYDADFKKADMHELAGVTPICSSATRHLAVDLLQDVLRGYQTDYDRKKAQLVIALLQQAVNETGNSVPYDTSTSADALGSWIETAAEVSEVVDSGLWIMSNASRWEIIRQAIMSGISGDIKQVLTSGNLQPLLGTDIVVVPNELLPKLGTSQTRTFTLAGTPVTIDQAVFHADLATFIGRVSGGLSYDISDRVAYEVQTEEGLVVRSAYQRNEIVARGSFKRNGAILDPSQVAGLSSTSDES